MAHPNQGFATDEYANIGEPVPPYPQTAQAYTPPNNNDIIAMPRNVNAIYIPPLQYDGPAMNYQVVISRPTPENHQKKILQFKNAHVKLGIVLVVFGGIQMLLDPLLPALFSYPYSIFPGGLFMVISGICSIHGSRRENMCSLRASLTFNILTLLLLFVGILMAIVVLLTDDYFNACKSSFSNCHQSYSLYASALKGLAIFNIVYEIVMIILLICHSAINCANVCCCRKREPSVNYIPAMPN